MATDVTKIAFPGEIDPPEAPKGTATHDDTAEIEETPLGFILDEPDEEKVAKHIYELRKAQDAIRSRNRATWKRNRWWREGKRFVRLEKKENSQAWEAKLPPGMASAPPVPNKTDRLCRRLVNTIMVDPPYPECEPGDNSSEARDAAEFATRYLAVKGSPSDLNTEAICRRSLDKAMTYASTYAVVHTDPAGSGHRPRLIGAHPEAATEEDALLDPATGSEAPEEELTDRYLRANGTITDDPTEAELQWLPGPKVRLLTGLQLDLLPETATGIDDAIGIVIADTSTLGDLKQQFPDVIEALSEDEMTALCTWRPDNFRDLIPPYTAEPEDQKTEDGKWKDSQTVVTLCTYYKRCAEYPWGCYAIAAGEKFLLHRQKWSAFFPQQPKADGTERPDAEETLEIPASQLRCMDDNVYDNPAGIALTESLGPADEIRASALGFELEYMFRFGNPQPFIPMGSIIQPQQLRQRDGTPVMVNPNGQVFYEPVPALPQTIPTLREEMGHEMDDESGLQQAGQGVEDPSVKSGIHARVVVQEALKAVGHIRTNTAHFYIRLNRILLEQARAFADVQQMISYVGDDGQYKEKEWSRTTFRNTKNVTIARGSFTMHTLLAKQEMANEAFDRKMIDPEEYKELISGGVSPVLGMQDDPHLMRVRTQIEVWQDGPPEGWMEAVQAVKMAEQEAAAAQAFNTPMPGLEDAGTMPPEGLAGPPLPPIPPMPPGPFDDHLPIDLEPLPAKRRHRELSKAMAGLKFQAYPPEWQETLLAEYRLMANAAGVITVPQAQAAQQAGMMGAPGNEQGLPSGPAQPGQPALQQPGMGPIGPDGGAPAGAMPGMVPGAQMPSLTVNLPDQAMKEIIHERDDRGAIIRSRIVPIGTQDMIANTAPGLLQ